MFSEGASCPEWRLKELSSWGGSRRHPKRVFNVEQTKELEAYHEDGNTVGGGALGMRQLV